MVVALQLDNSSSKHRLYAWQAHLILRHTGAHGQDRVQKCSRSCNVRQAAAQTRREEAVRRTLCTELQQPLLASICNSQQNAPVPWSDCGLT